MFLVPRQVGHAARADGHAVLVMGMVWSQPPLDTALLREVPGHKEAAPPLQDAEGATRRGLGCTYFSAYASTTGDHRYMQVLQRSAPNSGGAPIDGPASQYPCTHVSFFRGSCSWKEAVSPFLQALDALWPSANGQEFLPNSQSA